jgi:hypothetical protein
LTSKEEWSAGETPAQPSTNELDSGVPTDSQVRSAVVLQKKKKKKCEEEWIRV